ncbi:hypothetical protein [Fictibacillus arsenicus]|uniref:Uncharacterized protein n=1 Tax=Fictibacillus arsenicus TaxID=255247 RepID=A0A1V3GCL1_9BACL|nr:hypothetical protein [Fictibacillus arsenicus]OOE14575.1 hypothetical protein UN64_05125 [Fictibacillus arsenicus]
MLNFPTKIGDFIFEIQCTTNVFKEFLCTHFITLTKAQVQKPDITIVIKNNYGVPFVNYDVSTKSVDCKIFYKRADYLIEVNNLFQHAVISVHNELALKHALMNLFSAFLVHHNWGLLIHSSCAVELRVAHLFAGQSGAGKSTIARLSEPRKLLSDEASIIKITEDAVIVYDSPFRSELKPLHLQYAYPLKSIQFLNQALQNERVLINKADSLIQLIDKVFYWPYHSEETARIIQLLNLLVKQVPIYKLHFEKNNRFWELIS